MFTVCPKCALTLTVTAADLRVAQGFVRCGQCTNVFNALLGLSDERLPSAAAAVEEAAPQSAPAADEDPAPGDGDGDSPTSETQAPPADEESPPVEEHLAA